MKIYWKGTVLLTKLLTKLTRLISIKVLYLFQDLTLDAALNLTTMSQTPSI